jgi:hypothetical protein
LEIKTVIRSNGQKVKKGAKMQDTIFFRKIFRSLIIFTSLYFFFVIQAFDGNTWVQVDSLAEETQNSSGEMFTQFDSTDFTRFGLTALADFADLDSSYSENLHGETVFNSKPRYGTAIACTTGLPMCFAGHRNVPGGERNSLITSLFGTKYPTALDYTAWGALEPTTQSVSAWVLPSRWRTGAWGIFIGIGAGDTVMNSYRGGVTFRF